MFELIELIKEAKEFKRHWEKRGNDDVRKVQRAYLQGKIDAYQHILETEYPDWEDIYEFAKLSKQNTK
jgi:hypothetical protein